MSKLNNNSPFEQENQVPKKTFFKDPAMKWVVFADILGAIVIALLVWSSIISDQYEDDDLVAQAAFNQESQLVPDNVSVPVRNFDFDLVLTPENCENVSGVVDLVLITDSNYMDFTRVAINSAKQTKCPNSEYRFNVMTVDISDKDVEALKALEGEGVSVNIIPQAQADLFYIRDTHVSKASLLKYYIARALPELDKVLYLDSDILVLHDLNKIYQTDVNDAYLAAVKDPSWFFENTHVVELNLDERGFYFNTGVLLMNLKKIRDDDLLTKLEDFTNNNFRTYMDQDAFNVVVGNEVVLLPFEDNAMNFFFEHVDLPTLANFYGRDWQDIEDVFANVTILHFASSKKPLGPAVPSEQFFRMLQRLWYKYYTPLPPLEN